MNDTTYKLIILCGKAGSGKNYLLERLKEVCGNDINVIVADTTRPRRSTETPGVEYNFLTEPQFFNKEHLEVTTFNNWYYGTPIDGLKEDTVNVMILNPMSLLQVYKNYSHYDMQIFYITAPDKTRLLRQINRDAANLPEICRRFLADEKDFSFGKYFPWKVLTNSNEVTAEQAIQAIVKQIAQFNYDLGKIS